MKNLILGVLLAGGMIFAASATAEAGHGRRQVRRSYGHRHYTPVYRSYGYRNCAPRSYYGYGGYSNYGRYNRRYNSHIHLNYGRGGWGFSIH